MSNTKKEFIKFETSVGTITGVLDRARIENRVFVEFDQENEALLNKKYLFYGSELNTESGWVTIKLEDESYGNPEYKAEVISTESMVDKLNALHDKIYTPMILSCRDIAASARAVCGLISNIDDPSLGFALKSTFASLLNGIAEEIKESIDAE